ncbi:MAG: hypothetical protein HP490_18120 [Nitrospira sp.]|nr:hypothetical protein [Nitrospira sp.]
MRSIINRRLYLSCAKTGVLGLALIGLAGCTAGESSPGTVTTGGSAALNGPLVFVNNRGDRTLTTVALRGNSGNAVVNTLGSGTPGVFGNVALGDMQFSLGEWLFVNLGATNQVATIDPLTGATPTFEVNLTVGTRPVHLYRDPTDREVMWIMNDGNNTAGTDHQGDDLVNCVPAVPVPGQNYGSSVTIIHNSHLGPGATPPTVERTVCVLADGHKVSAFSQPTAADATIPRKVFVSSSTAGEIAVIDNTPVPGTHPNGTLINRIDLCNPNKEAIPATCDVENPARHLLQTVPIHTVSGSLSRPGKCTASRKPIGPLWKLIRRHTRLQKWQTCRRLPTRPLESLPMAGSSCCVVAAPLLSGPD